MYHSSEHEERGCTRNSIWAMIVATINKPALSVRNGTKQKKTTQVLQVLNVAMKLTTYTVGPYLTRLYIQCKCLHLNWLSEVPYQVPLECWSIWPIVDLRRWITTQKSPFHSIYDKQNSELDTFFTYVCFKNRWACLVFLIKTAFCLGCFLFACSCSEPLCWARASQLYTDWAEPYFNLSCRLGNLIWFAEESRLCVFYSKRAGYFQRIIFQNTHGHEGIVCTKADILWGMILLTNPKTCWFMYLDSVLKNA